MKHDPNDYIIDPLLFEGDTCYYISPNDDYGYVGQLTEKEMDEYFRKGWRRSMVEQAI